MNYDLGLIASVLESRDLGVAVKAGIKPKMLCEEAATYWDILTVHYDQFHEVPDPDFFSAIVPSYQHVRPNNSIEAIIYDIKSRYLYSELQEALKDVAELSAQDPWAAKDRMLKLAADIAIELQLSNSDFIAGEDKEHVLRKLEMLRHNGGLLGLPWPWEYLNENTIGIMPGNFLYFYGREKSRKTWLLLYMALYWESLGHRVLFVTREMSREEIAWRLYPLRAKLNYSEMTKGNISSDGKVTLENVMDDLFAHKNIIVSEVANGIAGLRAKIEEVEPTIVIHDYMKGVAEDEMGDKMTVKEHQYVARIADKFKELAVHFKIPIVGCGHANRDGEKFKGKSTTEIGHSDHIARKADIVFRVIIDDVRDKMAIIIAAGRNVQKYLSWTINASMDGHFGEFDSPDTRWVDEVDDVSKASQKSKEENSEAEKSLKDVQQGLRTFKPKKPTKQRRT